MERKGLKGMEKIAKSLDTSSERIADSLMEIAKAFKSIAEEMHRQNNQDSFEAHMRKD